MPTGATMTRDSIAIRHRRQEQADRLIALAEHLPAADRDLLVPLLQGKLTTHQAAGIAGLSVNQLRSRLQRIKRRMDHPLFALVARSSQTLPPTTRSIAHAVVIQGRSLRDAAQHTGTTLHQVRQNLAFLQVLRQAAA